MSTTSGKGYTKAAIIPETGRSIRHLLDFKSRISRGVILSRTRPFASTTRFTGPFRTETPQDEPHGK
jgi:hypothetical protein